MSKLEKITTNSTLDQNSLELLGDPAVYAELPIERLAVLRTRVLQRIDNETTPAAAFLTIRSDEGDWIEIAPLVEKKILSIDRDSGTESYLLRLQPGAAPGQHCHDVDELCIVLEGDVSFDDVYLKAGDFHLARKGSSHGVANTVNGAVIFLQSGLAAA